MSELATGHPLVDLRLLRSASVAITNGAALLLSMAMYLSSRSRSRARAPDSDFCHSMHYAMMILCQE
jgi:hypothetical protein